MKSVISNGAGYAATTDSSGNPAGKVVIVDGLYSNKAQVNPTNPDDSNAETPEWLLTVATAQAMYGARVSVGAGDDVVASTRLLNNGADVAWINPDSTIVVQSDVAITRLDIVGIGTADAAATHVLAQSNSTLANFATAMMTFEFASTDIVKRVTVTMSPQRILTGTATTAVLIVKGYKNG